MDTSARIEEIFREEGRSVLAVLVRHCGDLDQAEDARQEAFSAAWRQWPNEGVPEQPRAWLISVAKRRWIDAQRKRRPEPLRDDVPVEPVYEPPSVEDDELRLICLCCHPELSTEAQVALTLREVAGLTTEEIARAFLVSTETMAQRLVRAKGQLRKVGATLDLPEDALGERMSAVLGVIYLIYNEGYSASSGDALLRVDLSDEAIRLGKWMVRLTSHSGAAGLLALMLLNESRRATRTDANGDLVLLEDQDRRRWDPLMIDAGNYWLVLALRGELNRYSVLAAISAIHANAAEAAQTDWNAIVGWYNRLLAIEPSPVVALNRAVAVAMRDGPEEGILLIRTLIGMPELKNYAPAFAACADLHRRLGQWGEAREAYAAALARPLSEPMRRYLQRRMEACGE